MWNVSHLLRPGTLGSPSATTSTSTSLEGRASPRAREPKRQTETRRRPKWRSSRAR